MSMIFELIITVVVMIVAFFMMFLAMYMLAMFLAPVERALSKMVWAMTTPKVILAAPKASNFKNFSAKH